MLPLSSLNGVPLPLAAQTYALLGFEVFPCTPGDKTPLVPWTEQATDGLERIAAWWTQWPEANIGLPMGGGLHALDIDKKGGQDGWASYRALGGPPNPPWPAQRTPSGGLHILFEAELPLANFVGRGAHGGLDMRTDRGYILGSPSRVGGKPYRWRDGDPVIPLPRSLEEALVSYSTIARERALEAFPMVEEADLSEDRVEALLDDLGALHARFLREGVSESGNASWDAYHACLRAFTSGWTLHDMAAIGPRTYLAAFGAEAPHHATNPWAWAWRYTVKAAWIASGRGRQKEAPGPGGTEPGRSTDRDTEKTHAADGGALDGPSIPEVYELLQEKAQRLADWDETGAFNLLQEAVGSGIPPSRLELTLQAIKRATRIPLGVLRARQRELEQEALRRKAEHNPAPMPEIYVRAQGRYYNPVSRRLLSMDAVIAARASELGGDIQASRDQWMRGALGALPTVEDLAWDPREPEGVYASKEGVRYFNTYKGPTLQPREGDVSPWLQLLDDLDLEEGDLAKEHLLDWFAHCYQRPGEKIQHGVILGGAHGIGKDSLLLPVWEALGQHNVQPIGTDALIGSYQDYLADTKVVHITELLISDLADQRAVNQRLKLMLASPPEQLRVDQKYQRPYFIPNVVQMFACTNHRDCLSPEPGERRYAAFWCGQEIPEDPDLRGPYEDKFIAYHKWVDDGGAAAVAWFLQERDLSNFNPAARPPLTDWYHAMVENQRDPLEAWIINRIIDKSGPFEFPYVQTHDVINHMSCGKDLHLLQGKMGVRRVNRAMAAVGGVYARYWDGTERLRGWRFDKVLAAQTKQDRLGVIVRAEERFAKKGLAPPESLRKDLEL